LPAKAGPTDNGPVAQAGSGREGVREALAAASLALAGLLPRLLFARELPAAAFSDFRALIDFGLAMRDHGWSAESWHWIQFNPGLAMALSLLFGVVREPEAAARLSTAAVTGLLPLLPFFLWRPFLRLRWRVVSGLLLAFWPGQIFFSGVVAQENWVLLPAVALATLAVRVVRSAKSGVQPLAAGLLLAAAAAFRQEMLVVLLPAAVAAAGLLRPDSARRRHAAQLALAAAAILLALALQRAAASGRFAITTEHGGFALLGSVVPGAAEAGWVDPRAHIASVEPELLENRTAARKAGTRLALVEWRRRPAFQLLRAGSVSARLAVESDADNLYWSVGAPEALPPELRPRGARLYARWFALLRAELALVFGLFVASVLRALRRRDAAILVLATCVLLKFALQAVASPLGRLMVPATALELLVIGLGLSELATRRSGVRFGLVALAVAASLLFAEPRLTALAAAKDEPPRAVRRFPLEIAGGGMARCAVEDGDVTSLEWRRVWLRPRNPDRPARVRCRADGEGSGALIVRIETGGVVREVPLGEGDVTLPVPGAFSLSRATAATRSTPPR
jgi:hypothetical protein